MFPFILRLPSSARSQVDTGTPRGSPRRQVDAGAATLLGQQGTWNNKRV